MFNLEEIDQLPKMAEKKKIENKKYLDRLRTQKLNDVNNAFEEAHDEVFENTNCLNCGNCCKTTSPMFNRQDMERLAKALKMKPGALIEKYLRIDEDDHYVVQQLPCPFLASDNSCSVYNDRPKACREYPHTNHRPINQVFDITLLNASICPAVYDILERLKVVYPMTLVVPPKTR
jgi:Fe-S-cluster containining protein